MRRTKKMIAVVFSLLILVIIALLIAGGILGTVGRPIRYELPEGYRGWVVIQYQDPTCAPIRTEGIYLIITIPPSGRACTSDAIPRGWRYTRYDYVSPDGTRKTIPSSGWNPKREIWAGSWAPVQQGVTFPRSSFFVGTKAELEKSWPDRPQLRNKE